MHRLYKPAPKDRSDFVISPVKVTELAELSQLSKTTYEETFPGYYSKEQLEMLFSYPQLLKHFNHPNHFYLVAKKHGEMIGYAKLIYEDGKQSAFLDKLYLLKEHQQSGLGKVLILACYQHAISRNNTVMSLHVWDKNENAVRFYERCGFVTTTKIPYFYPDGSKSKDLDWLMICHDIPTNLLRLEGHKLRCAL